MREFHQPARTGKPKVWAISRDGNAVLVEWGRQGGKMQQTTQTFNGVNIGKVNEKEPIDVAQEWLERQVLLHTRKGYRELMDGELAPVDETFRLGALAENLRFWKPQNSVNAYMTKLMEQRKAWYGRKRDGYMHVLDVDNTSKATLYSSAMALHHKDEDEGTPWLDRYPEVQGAVARVTAKGVLPCGTILLGELVAPGGVDDRNYVSSVIKSLTPRALELQREGPRHLEFCIWDVAMWRSEMAVAEYPYSRRLSLLYQIQDAAGAGLTAPEVIFHDEGEAAMTMPGAPGAIEVLATENGDLSQEEALELAKAKGWEGFVVIDPDFTFGDRAYSFLGKQERPKGAVKLKPTVEADFIVRWDPDGKIGTWGRGKKAGGVGAVFCYLWNEEKQEEVYIGKCGGGLTAEDVKRFADASLYPLVWQIEFAHWSDNGSIQEPRYVRVREDKQPHECGLEQRP